MANPDHGLLLGLADNDHPQYLLTALHSHAYYVFDVRDYGATGDGTTDDSTAIQAAYDACEAAGGGIILYPRGYTFKAAATIDANKPILVSGYGATLIPTDSNAAIHVNSGSGSTASGITIEGVKIDGSTATTPTGIAITNTDRVRLRDVRIESCLTGVELKTVSSGWVEGTSLEHVWIQDCVTGILFNPVSGTSFGETFMADVGINNCTTGIKLSNTANMYRSRLLGVTMWINDNQTGFDIAGDMRGVIGQWAIETIGTPTGATGVWVAATALNLDRAMLNIEFTGNINTHVGSAGPSLIWSEGPLWHLSASGTQPAAFAQYGDTWPRVRIENEHVGGGGMSFGPGDAATDVELYRVEPNVLYTPDQFRIGGTLNHRGARVGFYGAAPLPQQTGVAVTEAAIHAALVNLGLITA